MSVPGFITIIAGADKNNIALRIDVHRFLHGCC